MSQTFDARTGPIVVRAVVSGPAGTAVAKLILDTGATHTTLNETVLRSVGYEPAAATELVSMTTGSETRMVPRLMVNRFTTLDRHAIGMRVLAHSLPIEADVDGLLGLDFFRDLFLGIDFRAGLLSLT